MPRIANIEKRVNFISMRYRTASNRYEIFDYGDGEWRVFCPTENLNKLIAVLDAACIDGDSASIPELGARNTVREWRRIGSTVTGVRETMISYTFSKHAFGDEQHLL